MEGLENLSAQYSQRPEEWVPEAATFETAKSYREKKAIPLIQKLVKVLFALHRKYWEVKGERDKYLHFYQDEKKATHHLSQRLKEVEAENSQLYVMKRDFRRVWNYFGAEKMQQDVYKRQVLGTVTSRIVNEVKHVNRVFYDCTGKPPATIELE